MGRPTCWHCQRPVVGCICDLVPRIVQRTRLVIIQHPRERKHPFGTVRLARLGLENVEVRVADHAGHRRLSCPGAPIEDGALLYPTPGAVDIAALTPAPRTLVVVDGTWSTAHKLVRDTPWIAALPAVSIAPPRPGNYRIRRARDPSRQLSTIEAIAYALQTLEGRSFAPLLEAFDAMVDRQLALQDHCSAT